MREEDQPYMTVSLKIDKDTNMGIVNDVKQALRKAYALKISYAATGKEESKSNIKIGRVIELKKG